MSKKACCLFFDQKSVATMSSLAFSLWFAVRSVNCSPDRGCNCGSMEMSEQTCLSKEAVWFCRSLCQRIGYPPCWQLRQWSTVNGFPQMQVEGRRGGSQSYLRHRASLKSDLWRWKFWSCTGMIVTQLEAPFSLAQSICFWRSAGNSARRDWAAFFASVDFFFYALWLTPADHIESRLQSRLILPVLHIPKEM